MNENVVSANVTHEKKNETFVTPKIKESFNAQQKEKFNSSLGFTDWNMKLRQNINELNSEIFDKWKQEYDDQLLLDWRKGSEPEEAAKNIFNLFMSDSGPKKRRR